MAEGLSVALPLVKSDEDGPYLIHKNLEDVAKQNLKMVILTSPGERVMDPNFGVGIRNYLFEQSTPGLVSRIRTKVEKQVKLYVPFVKILNLDVSTNPDEGLLSLRIRYAVPRSNVVADLTIPVSS